jgi:hypothetical protein
MAVLRLNNGDDLVVRLSITEAVKKLADDGFVEFETDEGAVQVRSSAVIAIIDSSDRKTTGFRIGARPDAGG